MGDMSGLESDHCAVRLLCVGNRTPCPGLKVTVWAGSTKRHAIET